MPFSLFDTEYGLFASMRSSSIGYPLRVYSVEAAALNLNVLQLIS